MTKIMLKLVTRAKLSLKKVFKLPQPPFNLWENNTNAKRAVHALVAHML